MCRVFQTPAVIRRHMSRQESTCQDTLPLLVMIIFSYQFAPRSVGTRGTPLSHRLTNRNKPYHTTMNFNGLSPSKMNITIPSRHEACYRQSEQSAMSSFLDTLFNEASTVHIQIDNARITSRRRSSLQSVGENDDSSGRSKDKASMRWEKLSSKDRNDVMVTAPLRRSVYEVEVVEKKTTNHHQEKSLNRTKYDKEPTLSLRKLSPLPVNDEGNFSSPCNSCASSTTSEVLEMALDLINCQEQEDMPSMNTTSSSSSSSSLPEMEYLSMATAP